MPGRRLFLSIVTSEFCSYRQILRADLRGPYLEVKVQEDFIQLGGDTLSLLDDYIALCDDVIHLIGDATGAYPAPVSIQRLLQRHPDFTKRVPMIRDLLPNAEFSYTQWEAYLAIYHEKRLFIYQAAPQAPRDPGFVPDTRQRESQQKHLQRLQSIDHWGETFPNHERLSTIVYRSILNQCWCDHLLVVKSPAMISTPKAHYDTWASDQRLSGRRWVDSPEANASELILAIRTGATSTLIELPFDHDISQIARTLLTTDDLRLISELAHDRELLVHKPHLLQLLYVVSPKDPPTQLRQVVRKTLKEASNYHVLHHASLAMSCWGDPGSLREYLRLLNNNAAADERDTLEYLNYYGMGPSMVVKHVLRKLTSARTHPIYGTLRSAEVRMLGKLGRPMHAKFLENLRKSFTLKEDRAWIDWAIERIRFRYPAEQ